MIGLMRMAAVAALAGGSVLAGVGPAAPADAGAKRTCSHSGVQPNGADATCSGLARGEKFRVWVDCAPGYRAHGPWRTGENETSRVYCNVAADARTGLGHELVIST